MTATAKRQLPPKICWQTDALRALAQHAPTYLLDSGDFRPNCCIAATRIILDVCLGLDIPAMPAVTEVLLYSPGWLTLREQLGHEPTAAEMDAALGHDAWSVGLGVEHPPEGSHIENYDPMSWQGHLVAIAQVGPVPFLLDGTLRQAQRPQYGILTPRFVRLPISNAPNSLTRPLQGTPTLDQPGGTLMALSEPEPARGYQLFIYRRRATWNPYRDAPDWDARRFLHITLALGRDILEEVGECPTL